MWKVYNIQTGRIIKAGFENDDQAKDWLERRKDLADDEFDVEEMDEEEEEEYLESEADDDEVVEETAEVVDAEDVREISYPEESLDGDDDSDDDDKDADDDDDADEEEADDDDDDDD